MWTSKYVLLHVVAGLLCLQCLVHASVVSFAKKPDDEKIDPKYPPPRPVDEQRTKHIEYMEKWAKWSPMDRTQINWPLLAPCAIKCVKDNTWREESGHPDTFNGKTPFTVTRREYCEPSSLSMMDESSPWKMWEDGVRKCTIRGCENPKAALYTLDDVFALICMDIGETWKYGPAPRT